MSDPVVGRPLRVVAFRGFGVDISVTDATGLAIADRIAACAPRGLLATTPDAAATAYLITGTPEDGISVVLDGTIHYTSAAASGAVEWLRSEIDTAVAVGATDALFVHAGVVAWRGRAIVIPGRSGSGKSWLVAALVRRGACYYSDEYAPLDADGRVHPYDRLPLLSRDGSGTSYLDASQRVMARPALPVAMIVSTVFHHGARWDPQVLHGARGVLPLLDNAIAGRSQPARALAVARAVAPTAVAVCGLRPEAGDVAASLLERLDDLIDGAGPESHSTDQWSRRLEVIDRARRPATRAARCIVVPELLSKEDRSRLIDLAVAQQDEFEPSRVTDGCGEAVTDISSRRSRTLYALGDVGVLFERTIRRRLPYIRQELDMAWFRLDRVEVQLTVHEDGNFFAMHIDNGGPVAGRRVSCVYHFSAASDFEGGELVLYDSTSTGEVANSFVTIPPRDNTLVCFPSETWHEVRPVRSSKEEFAGNRFAVTMWCWEAEGPAPRSGVAATTVAIGGESPPTASEAV